MSDKPVTLNENELKVLKRIKKVSVHKERFRDKHYCYPYQIVVEGLNNKQKRAYMLNLSNKGMIIYYDTGVDTVKVYLTDKGIAYLKEIEEAGQ